MIFDVPWPLALMAISASSVLITYSIVLFVEAVRSWMD